MNLVAVRQAEERLARAEAAVAALLSATDFVAIERAWSAFLLAAAAIYSKLEQGAKGDGPGEAWLGRRKHERKLDPLLAYLHHARNSDEHSIAEVSARAATRYDAPAPINLGGVGVLGFTVDSGAVVTDFEVHSAGHTTPVVLSKQDEVTLVPVTDRGRTYAVPTSHMLAAVKPSTPQRAATLCLAYITNMVA